MKLWSSIAPRVVTINILPCAAAERAVTGTEISGRSAAMILPGWLGNLPGLQGCLHPHLLDGRTGVLALIAPIPGDLFRSQTLKGLP